MVIGDKNRCKICKDGKWRLRVVELAQAGHSAYQISKKIRAEGLICAAGVIERHIAEHEQVVVVWPGLVQLKFNTEEERKKFEAGFLTRISLVTELWDKYQSMDEVFKMTHMIAKGIPSTDNPLKLMLGTGPTKDNVDKVAKLGAELRSYIMEMMKLQRERDIVVEVAKTVLFMMADGFVSRLRFIVADMPGDKRDAIGRLLSEEVKKALEYSKGLGKEKIEDLLGKVNVEYQRLIANG